MILSIAVVVTASVGLMAEVTLPSLYFLAAISLFDARLLQDVKRSLE